MISRTLRFFVLIAIALFATTLLTAGRVLSHEDPLQPADALYVLGGNWEMRWLEAADLYAEHFAPHIVISLGTVDSGVLELQRRGIPYPSPPELARRALVDHLHIPPSAVEVLTTSVDNTAQEAEAIKAPVAEHHWRKLIVITDRATTRRAGFAMRRVLGSGVTIIMRASRFDAFSPGGWWQTRADFRTAFYEAPKLFAYWLGLKG